MRAYQIFAAMPQEHAIALLRTIKEQSPAMFTQSVQAACGALKSRPVYLLKQPFEKQAAAVRRAFSRVTANAVAQEALAVYFLECRKPLLIEWLDAIGLEHEEGILKQDAPETPTDEKDLENYRRSNAAANHGGLHGHDCCFGRNRSGLARFQSRHE